MSKLIQLIQNYRIEAEGGFAIVLTLIVLHFVYLVLKEVFS